MNAKMTTSLTSICLLLVFSLPVHAAPGPQLNTPEHEMAAATMCDEFVYPGSGRQAVLLIHGTGSTAEESWDLAYRNALSADGFGVCTVTLPERAVGDVDVTLEYAVYAARYAYQQSGKKIAIIGHSQGGYIAAWIAKFWPDVAKNATDIISLAGTMQGTQVANIACVAGACLPVEWELSVGSQHTSALINAPFQPMTAAFTSIGSLLDELVIPQPLASTLPGASNIMVQTVCPLHVTEHALLLVDAVAYALVLDALTHKGGAVASRISPLVCLQLFMPETDLLAAEGLVGSAIGLTTGLVDVTMFVDEEPPLPDYAEPYANPGTQ